MNLKVGSIKGYQGPTIPLWKELSKFPVGETNMEFSPYYNKSHVAFRKVVREFLYDEGIYDWCDRAEELGTGAPSQELLLKLGRSGILALCQGKGEHLKAFEEFPDTVWKRAGILSDDLDMFHFAIINAEIARMCCPGAADGVFTGATIGVGPLLRFGTTTRIREVGMDVLRGKITMCLGVTEVSGGTDVAGVKSTAVETSNGYLISGIKKWITGAYHAKYCTCLVRMKDTSELRVFAVQLRDDQGKLMPGVSLRKIEAPYSSAAGTSLIILENCFVPTDAKLKGDGLKVILHNFNLERWMIIAATLARCRRIVEEAFLWANRRQAFKKTLTAMPVVRLRLGEILSELNVLNAGFEALTYKYSIMSFDQQNALLGGETALLKYSATRSCLHICDQAVNIFGGRGVISNSGLGKCVARTQRVFKVYSIGGGTEDAMLDLGVRLQLRTLNEARL